MIFTRRALLTWLALIGITIAALAPGAMRPATAQTAAGSTTLISIAADGTLPTGHSATYSSAWGSGSPRISADGNYVVFSTNMKLVLKDTNGLTDVYIYDRANRQHILASPAVNGDAAGIEAYGSDVRAAISADGMYVVYESTSSQLVPGDTNGKIDIFVFDRVNNTVSRVLTSSGAQPDGDSVLPDISGDGNRIVFASRATNLFSQEGNSIFFADRDGAKWKVAGRLPIDSGGNPIATKPAIAVDGAMIAYQSRITTGTKRMDIFLAYLNDMSTTRVTAGDQDSTMPEVSDDGYIVTFKSAATNLVSGDTNGLWDIFVYDWGQRSTTRVSNGYDGSQANGHSGDASSVYGGPTISGDGRYVAFPSAASNLVEGDTNGQPDIFVYDMQSTIQSQRTSRISLTSAGGQGDGASSGWPSMSSDHNLIAFTSAAR
ncbi:hypothetical protein K2Z83_27910, partial [Oscillochloris sp. ZM17-4]|uniref:TolB family protein n=1 Tax=Oscillochloris sp. ZM17-4 TaxID=2866714 RepID=UPI001C72B576